MENKSTIELDKEIAKLTKQFGDALTDERKMSMALLKLGIKKERKIKEEEIMTKKTKEETLDLDDVSLDDEVPETSGWKRFLSTIPDPSESETLYEKTANFELELGATYHFKLTDPNKEPFSMEKEGKWGPYTKHALKVTLLGVNDEDLLNKLFEYGEEKGALAYTIGRNYTLWIYQSSMEYMKAFWAQLTDDGLPDGRSFSYKETKKGKKNVYIYGESKF